MRLVTTSGLWVFLFVLLSPAAHAQTADQTVSTADLLIAIDNTWLITATVLVFLMQAGFLALESGMVRAKNSINIAQKNLADVILATLIFGFFGFAIMFGPTVNGVWGFDAGWLFLQDIRPELLGTFAFQAVFCGTAATLVSGAVAERMGLVAFFCVAILIAAVIYPVFGHWAWGNLILTDQVPFLVERGFVDFAGATVVHSIGAWVALAAILTIGPRVGKYTANGTPLHIQGHNMAIAGAGGLLLWIGWLGFNAGGLSPLDPSFSQVIANTLLAGAVGGIVHMLFGRLNDGIFRPAKSINGILSGLVAVTASANIVSAPDAMLIAAIGSIVGLYLRIFLEWVLRLDDPISVVAVHGCVGVWGTLAVAFFGNMDALPTGDRFSQFVAQGEGIALAFAWSFGVSYVALKVIDRLLKQFGSYGLRVPLEDEERGLNFSEHGATYGTGALQQAMHSLAHANPDWKARVRVEPGDESSELGAVFNRLMDRLETDHEQRIANERERTEQVEAALTREQELNLLQQNFVSMVSHEFRTPVTIIDGAAQRLDRRKERLNSDDVDKVVTKIRTAVRRMIALIDSTLSASKLEAGRINFAPQDVDVKALVEECCTYQQELASSHVITTKWEGVPENIFADPLLLTQIFSNLLSNAVKYAPNAPDIHVHGKCSNDRVTISVKDHGLGIPEDELPKLFTRFFRARTSTGIAGTGVGLNVVKEFTEMHGGSVDVKSDEGKGTTFEVTIPIKAEEGISNKEAEKAAEPAFTPQTATAAPQVD